MLSGKYLPIRADLNEGELFSSWLTRLAHRNSMKLSTMLHYLFNDKQLLIRDIDRPFNHDHLSKMAYCCGITETRLLKTTLSSYEGIIYTEKEVGSNIAWVLPATKYTNEVIQPGIQYCPYCLAETDNPFYKVEHKLSLLFICHKHHCWLRNSCSNCGAYLNFHLLKINDEIDACYKCKKKVWLKALNNNDNVNSVQKILLKWLKDGYVKINNKPIHTYLVLVVIRSWITLLTINKHAPSFTRILRLKLDINRKPFEYLSSEQRSALIGSAIYLMEDWPDNFLKFVKETKQSSYMFYGTMKVIPYWYWKVIDEYIYKPFYKYTDEEVLNAVKYMQSKGIKITFHNSRKILGSGDAVRNRILSGKIVL